MGIAGGGKWLSLLYRSCPLTRFAFTAIGDQIRGDAQQPGSERRPRPFEARQTGQGAAEDFGRQVLCLSPAAQSTRHVGVNQREIALIDVTKPRAIELCCLDQAPFSFAGNSEANLLCRFANGHYSSIYLNCDAGERLRYGRPIFPPPRSRGGAKKTEVDVL